MKRKTLGYIAVYLLILGLFLALAAAGSRAVTVLTEHAPLNSSVTAVIDAGHGGIDGGSVSCSGVYESQINLEIALRLEDLMHLLGIHTEMIRTTDCSVYTSGETIAAKKVSDLKERVRRINAQEQAVLISIHQNSFPDSRYRGPQVFYPDNAHSQNLAASMQQLLNSNLGPECTRKIKKADGIYLMQHITCPGILIECGFLSNPREEALLRTADYQKKLCCIIAVGCSNWLQTCQTA